MSHPWSSMLCVVILWFHSTYPPGARPTKTPGNFHHPLDSMSYRNTVDIPHTPMPYPTMLPPPTGIYPCAGACVPVRISRRSPHPPSPSSSRSRTAVPTACGSSSPVPRADHGVPKVRIGGAGARREAGWVRTESGRLELITIPHNP